MLERFQVPATDEVIVQEDQVRSATEAIFRKMGLGEKDAAQAADILVLSDLRGHESHGVSNMLRRYVEYYGSGYVNPDPQIRTLRESAVTATWDGDAGLGLQTGRWAMELAMEKAAEYGIGSVAVQNSRHLGMLAYYPLMAVKRDMIGVCMASAGGQLMVPIFGAEPRFGTHPFSWAAPAGKMPPFVLDMATSQVAGNKLDLTRRIGSKLAPWLDRQAGRHAHRRAGRRTWTRGIHAAAVRRDPRARRPQGVRDSRHRGHHVGHPVGQPRRVLRQRPLLPVRNGVQHRRLHGRRPVQGRYGRVDGDTCEHPARAGPRPRVLRRALGG